MKHATAAGAILKSLTAFLSALALIGAVSGFYLHEWYAGFSLVLFITSVICHFAIHTDAQPAHSMKQQF